MSMETSPQNPTPYLGYREHVLNHDLLHLLSGIKGDGACWVGIGEQTDMSLSQGGEEGPCRNSLQAPDTCFIAPLDKFQDTNAKVKLLIISIW